MKRIVFIAISSLSKIVIDILKYESDFNKRYTFVGFIDDDKTLKGQIKDGLPILGPFKDLYKIIQDKSVTYAVICLPEGYMGKRKEYFWECKETGLNMTNVIHPQSIIAHNVSIGEGVIIVAGVVINPATRIGNNVIIWTGATIDHDNIIEDNVYISPGVNLAGLVTIRDCAFIGTGATVLPKVTIGRNSVIGAGALVNKDIPDNVVAYGVPARVIRKI